MRSRRRRFCWGWRRCFRIRRMLRAEAARARRGGAEPGGAVPHADRTDSGGGVHGLPGSRRGRSVRQSADRDHAGILAGGMAGGSGSLVRANSPGRQTALERGSRGDVSLRPAAAFGLPGDRSRRPGGFVSLQCAYGAARRRTSLVHSWGGVRHHGSQARRGGVAERAQFRFGRGGHGGRAGSGARPRGPHRAVQPGLRADHRIRFQRGDRQAGVGTARGAGRRRTVPRSVRRVARRPASGSVRERVDQPAGRAAVDCLVQHGAARSTGRFGIRDSYRNRRDGIEAPGAYHSGNQRPGTAADRAGPARWIGAAPDGRGFFEQGAGAETARKRSAGGGRGGQDCGVGEPGDQPDAGTLPRPSAGAFRCSRSDECAGAAGAGGGGSVPGILPVRMRPSGVDSRRQYGDAPVSHRAGGGEQLAEARAAAARIDPSFGRRGAVSAGGR